MLPLEAAIGRAQLQRVAGFMHRRREIAPSTRGPGMSRLELLPGLMERRAIMRVRLQQLHQRRHVLKSRVKRCARRYGTELRDP